MQVLLADDQVQVRAALRLLLEQETRFHVVGEAAEARRLLALMRATYPDVVLLDWELPGLRAMNSLKAMRSICPHVLIVAFSSWPEAQARALEAGADAFVNKGDPPPRLREVLRSVESRLAPPEWAAWVG